MSGLARVPVFRKDLRALLRPLLWFVALRLVYVPTVMLVFFGREQTVRELPEILRVTGWMFGQLFALVAVAHLQAEERAAGTLVFLRRLPASRARIYGEKALAGLAALALLWILEAAVQGGARAAVGVLGGDLSQETSLPGDMGILAAVTITSYLVGVPLSLVARQAVVVVLVGCALWWTGFGLLLSAQSPVLIGNLGWLAVVVLPILAAVVVLGVLPDRRLRLPAVASSFARRFGLLWKGLAENGVLTLLSLLFLAVAWAAPPSLDALWIQAGAIILVTSLGAAAYGPTEKHGLHSVLYQHPVPRGRLFWSKAAVALVPLLAISAATALRWSFPGPTPILLVLAFVTYAYACALLLSLAIERQSTAALGAQCVVTMTALVPLGLTELFRSGTGFPWDERVEALARASTPGFIILAVGCMLAGWWLAGNRSFLTSSTRRRAAWAGGALSLLLLLATVAGTLAWRTIWMA